MLNFNLRSIVMLLQHFSEPSNRRLRLVALPINSVLDWVLISAPIFLRMASVGVLQPSPSTSIGRSGRYWLTNALPVTALMKSTGRLN